MSNKNDTHTEGAFRDFFTSLPGRADNFVTNRMGTVASNTRNHRNSTTTLRGGMNHVKNAYGDFSKDNTIDARSIVARAQSSNCQFPVYMSQSIRPNEAHIIGKAFERVYATFVQTVMSQNPIVDVNQVNNMAFLKNFHSNIQESGPYWVESVGVNDDLNLPSLRNEFYTPIDEFDSIMEDSLYRKIQISENAQAVFRVVPCKDRDLIKEHSLSIHEPLEGLKYLQEATDDSWDIPGIVSTREMEDILNNHNLTLPAGTPPIDFAQMQRDIQSGSTIYQHNGSPIRCQIVNGKAIYYASDQGPRRSIKNSTDHALDAPKLLRDSDIKKLNGMLPYTIEVNLRIRREDGALDNVRFIIGVKTVLHLINPSDLSSEVRDILSGKEKNLQKVRYKTGEISLVNYLFNNKGLKSDSLNHINSDKRWLNTLKRLGEYESLHGTILKQPAALIDGNVPAPVGTMVLTQADVLRINDETSIDLSTVSNAKRLARALFLISVVIVDSTGGSMRVLMVDTDNDWDVQSLNSLELEANKTDNNALGKEISKMINKG